MRPGATFQSASAAGTRPVNQTAAVHSARHSLVPYLFGGLAAMLGLIAFALLILALSYWKLSGYLDGDDDSQTPGGEKSSEAVETLPLPSVEPRVVVIMAGEDKPTYIATAMSSRSASSVGDNSSNKSTAAAGEVEKRNNGEAKAEADNEDGEAESLQKP